MISLDLIRRLHDHRRWCNANLRTTAATLSEAQLRRRFDLGQGSVWATLVHLYAAEHVWLEALLGRDTRGLPGEEAFASFEELQIAWSAGERRWQRYLDSLTPKMLAHPVYKTSSRNPTGQAMSTPAYDVLLHVCTHAQYTTAQAVHMLRHLGVEPLPETMLITLSRQEHRRESV